MREAKAGSGMKHSPTVKSVVRGLALLFFICCFGLQVWSAVLKFFSHATTTSSSVELTASHLLPRLIFCPGYKPGVIESSPNDRFVSLFMDVSKDVTTAAEEEVVGWWNASTYTFNEVVQKYRFFRGHEWLEVSVGPNPDHNVTVEELWTLWGKCYSLQCHEEVKKFQYVRLVLKADKGKMIAVYATGPGFQFGLYYNAWTFKQAMIELRPGEVKEVALAAEKVTISSDVCTAGTSDVQEYNECRRDWIKTKFTGSPPKCGKVCAFPQVRYILDADYDRLQQCVTRSDLACMVTHFHGLFVTALQEDETTGCEPPCALARFDVTARTSVLSDPSSDTANLTFFYSENNVRKLETVLLYDFGAIVSAVGGSLGLFLGFSCWHMANCLLDKIPPWATY